LPSSLSLLLPLPLSLSLSWWLAAPWLAMPPTSSRPSLLLPPASALTPMQPQPPAVVAVAMSTM